MAKYWGTTHFKPSFFSNMTQNGLKWSLKTN